MKQDILAILTSMLRENGVEPNPKEEMKLVKEVLTLCWEYPDVADKSVFCNTVVQNYLDQKSPKVQILEVVDKAVGNEGFLYRLEERERQRTIQNILVQIFAQLGWNMNGKVEEFVLKLMVLVEKYPDTETYTLFVETIMTCSNCMDMGYKSPEVRKICTTM